LSREDALIFRACKCKTYVIKMYTNEELGGLNSCSNWLNIREKVAYLNPLTQRRMTCKDVINSVSKFGGIMFTPIWLTAVACYALGSLKLRLSFRSHNVPPPPLKPLHKHQYIRRQ